MPPVAIATVLTVVAIPGHWVAIPALPCVGVATVHLLTLTLISLISNIY